MRNLILPLLTLCFLPLALSAKPDSGMLVPLWPESFLGKKPADDVFKGSDNDRSVQRVTTPSMEIFKPTPDKDTGAVILVAPGGGYERLAYDKEGVEIARWLNSFGVTGIVLRYRVPAAQGTTRGQLPLQDSQRAISLIRANAEAWKIDPQRVGMLGFSAGGHLAARTSTVTERTYSALDGADKQNFRPNFTMLIYPAYLVTDDKSALLPEIAVTKETPPAILVHAIDDRIPCENSLHYFSALRKASVLSEMHIYTRGGHGYGMRKELPSKTWPACVAAWIKSEGWLKAK